MISSSRDSWGSLQSGLLLLELLCRFFVLLAKGF
jgi:hypothetical protein